MSGRGLGRGPILFWQGPGPALAAAALFGLGIPLAKLLLGSVDPWMLAGLFYLGSGCGLAGVRAVGRWGMRAAPSEAPLKGSQWLWLGGAILSGGVVGPVLLMLGLAATPASTASLLLNFEAVFTVLLAWLAFGESLDRRTALGAAAILSGAVLLSSPGGLTGAELMGPIAIGGATLAWALDNNLTRRVALGDPVEIAMMKGLAAGTVNVVLAAAGGAAWPGLDVAAAAALVGLGAYGVSLVLYVLALRHIGAARTGAYFALAPFVGAVAAVGIVGDPVTLRLGGAGLLMGLGAWLAVTERHRHEHRHEALVHEHRHVHDRHHRHAHGPDAPPAEPHSHPHAHDELVHEHPHFPDPHHRHRHVG